MRTVSISWPHANIYKGNGEKYLVQYWLENLLLIDKDKNVLATDQFERNQHIFFKIFVTIGNNYGKSTSSEERITRIQAQVQGKKDISYNEDSS